MTALAMLWTDIRILLVDTTRIWWKLLPKLLAIYLLGWLGFHLVRQQVGRHGVDPADGRQRARGPPADPRG
jgi:hypothetical protein